MSTTSEALDLKPGARGQRGRKGSDGIEEAIKAAPIKEASKEVMALYMKKQLAAADYNAAIKAMAERSNTNARNLNKLFKASAQGKYTDVRRDIDQQSVIFEVVGEIPGGGTEKE